MTERFTVDYDITTGNYDIHDKKKSNGIDGYIAYLSDEERANNLCSLLNEQEETIQSLKKELFESEKNYIIETYSDNPIRRDEKIQSLKEEFKARFGDVE